MVKHFRNVFSTASAIKLSLTLANDNRVNRVLCRFNRRCSSRHVTSHARSRKVVARYINYLHINRNVEIISHANDDCVVTTTTKLVMDFNLLLILTSV